MLGRYGKIFALGHRATKGLLDKPVVVEEKVDGSQISWGLLGDPPRLSARSKRLTLDLDEPPNLFGPSVASIRRMAEDGLLSPGVVYRGEAMGRPRHNTLTYGRVPKGHIALFDVDAGTQDYLAYEEKARVASRLGIEAVPLLFEGMLSSAARLEKLLELESFLGGPSIEGVVVKRAHQVPLFGEDGLPIRAKFVSEKFKEAHAVNPDWKRLRQTEFLKVLAESVSGPARWEKVVTGLLAEGLIEGGTPVEIGRIIRHIREDVRDGVPGRPEGPPVEALREALRLRRHQGVPRVVQEAAGGSRVRGLTTYCLGALAMHARHWLAAEIAEDLRTALEAFEAAAAELEAKVGSRCGDTVIRLAW